MYSKLRSILGVWQKYSEPDSAFEERWSPIETKAARAGLYYCMAISVACVLLFWLLTLGQRGSSLRTGFNLFIQLALAAVTGGSVGWMLGRWQSRATFGHTLLPKSLHAVLTALLPWLVAGFVVGLFVATSSVYAGMLLAGESVVKADPQLVLAMGGFVGVPLGVTAGGVSALSFAPLLASWVERKKSSKEGLNEPPAAWTNISATPGMLLGAFVFTWYLVLHTYAMPLAHLSFDVAKLYTGETDPPWYCCSGVCDDEMVFFDSPEWDDIGVPNCWTEFRAYAMMPVAPSFLLFFFVIMPAARRSRDLLMTVSGGAEDRIAPG